MYWANVESVFAGNCRRLKNSMIAICFISAYSSGGMLLEAFAGLIL